MLKKMKGRSLVLKMFLGLSMLMPVTGMGDDIKPRAVISIIIDDIGYRVEEGRQMISLPADLTYAVLPNAPQAKQLARLAHKHGKEVMLHMPMQSTLGGSPEQGVLDVDMEERHVVTALQEAFAKVPHAIGMNNHQGSLLTRHPGHMTWVMKEMKRQNYFFVDSRTSSQSVAEAIAFEQGVGAIRRDVFLDHVIDEASIKSEFNRLVQLVQKRGHAVGIGHPHPETLAVLQDMLPMLDDLNIQLVPISQQINAQKVLVFNTKSENKEAFRQHH